MIDDRTAIQANMNDVNAFLWSMYSFGSESNIGRPHKGTPCQKMTGCTGADFIQSNDGFCKGMCVRI